MKKLNVLFLVGISALCASCEVPTGVVAGNSAIEVVADPSPTFGLPAPSGSPSMCASASPSPSSSASPYSCDPLGPSEGTAGPDNGLIGHLYYTPSGGTEYSMVEDYINNDPIAPADLYFNQLNVPTRSFSEGFSTQDGTVLVDPITGNTLYEWFALHFETEIRLGYMNTPGRYQLAVLSDDGSIVWLNQGNGFEQFINNDGETPSRLKCATSGIDFDWNTSIPMNLDYFQGPRYNIALMFLWRQIPEVAPGAKDSASALYDVACNQSGNDTFFLWENPPDVPTALWLEMLSNGWQVLSPENYFLPTAQNLTNPCTNPSPTPSVSSQPTAGPTTGPTPSPSVEPSASPSTQGATPTPTVSASSTPCSGPLCGGGVIGE